MNRPLIVLMLAVLPLAPGMSGAQDAALPDRAIYEAMLGANRDTGWVQFRNFAGRQLVYFTALQTLHCRLSEIRYSVNSDALDQRFDLVDCNAQLPFALPSDAGPDDIYLSLAPGTAGTVAVQAVWEDGVETEIMVYRPCDNVGEASCAVVVK